MRRRRNSVRSHLACVKREYVREDDGAARHRLLSEAINVVIGRWRNLGIQFMRTTLVSHGNILAAPVIGWILCAPKYLVGTMSLGEAAQAVAAFVMVQTALNWLVDNYPGLAECLSSVNRVGALLAALDELDQRRRAARRIFSNGGIGDTKMIPIDVTAILLLGGLVWWRYGAGREFIPCGDCGAPGDEGPRVYLAQLFAAKGDTAGEEAEERDAAAGCAPVRSGDPGLGAAEF